MIKYNSSTYFFHKENYECLPIFGETDATISFVLESNETVSKKVSKLT